MEMMTNLELEALRATLAREVLNIESLDILKKIQKMVKREVKKVQKVEKEKISDDPYFDNPENVKALCEAIEEVNHGEYIEIKTKEELHKFLGL